MQIEGKRVLITGAAGGIGRATASLFLKHGAQLFLVDRDRDSLEQVKAGFEQADAAVAIHTADVNDEAAARDMVRHAVRKMGGIDVLITASGAISEVPVESMSLTEWRQIMSSNLDSVFLACREVLPHMRSQHYGRIITVSSQIGQRGAPRFTHYAASKAGLIGFTKALAREVARDGILVNSVAPGPVLTTFNKDLRPETLAGTEASLPLGRAAQPEEIAGAILLLASSPHGDVFVGQTLGPNCGDVML